MIVLLLLEFEKAKRKQQRKEPQAKRNKNFIS
jgi:hypothetical protein